MTFLLVAAAVASVDARCAARVGCYQPPEGIVSTPESAARVGKIYLTHINGSGHYREELPLKVRLDRGVWTIEGNDLPPGWVGGAAEMQLCQSNGLHILAYNIKRAIALVGVPKLMAAMQT